jgi:hypothetical protein
VQPQHHLGDHRERAEGPVHELGEVVAGHVLDHVAAGAGDGAVREHERRADHEVPQRAPDECGRPGVAGREQPAHGGPVRDPRRVQRDVLPVPGELGVQLPQRGAGADGHRHVARVVGDHPGQAAGVQHRVDAAQRPGPDGGRARAGDGEGAGGVEDGVAQLAQTGRAESGGRTHSRSITPASSSGCGR